MGESGESSERCQMVGGISRGPDTDETKQVSK